MTRTKLVVAAATLLGLAAPLPQAHAAADHVHVIVGFTYVTGDTLCKVVGPGCGTDAILSDTVARGDTLTFTSLDPAPVVHSVVSDVEGLFDSGALSLNETGVIDTANLAPGTYRYHCEIHGKALMSGSFTVQ